MKSVTVFTVIITPAEIPPRESMVWDIKQRILDSDTELFLAVKEGNDQAFKKLYQKYYPKILNLIFRFIPNQQYAEDIAQDVFLRVYSGAGNFSPRATFSTWLHKITVNRCFSYHRKLQREREEYSSEADLHVTGEAANPVTIENHPTPITPPNGQVLRNELNQTIQSALRKLPPDQRMAFILSQYEGLSYKEVARIIGKSEKAVERQIYHARRKLKNLLKSYISL